MSKANSICFGVGNIDIVCEECGRNKECQGIIREKVCGIPATKPYKFMSREGHPEVDIDAKPNKYGTGDVNCEAIMEMYKKQCIVCDNAFTAKFATEVGSDERRTFALEVGKKQALEKVLSEVFGVHIVLLQEVEDEVRVNRGF